MDKNYKTLSAPFWVVWAIEFWERFGFYGFQAIIALYFTKQIGISEKDTIFIMGSFFAFAFGFIWVGGFIGDKVLGAKRSVVLGAVILAISYCSFIFANKESIFYILSGIIIGNAIFKANPSSLISKMFVQGDPRLKSAMTLYYLAINVGSLISMAITPVVAKELGYKWGFVICGIGLIIGLINFYYFYNKLETLGTEAGNKPLNKTKLIYVLMGALISFFITAEILPNTTLCISITAVIVLLATAYFLYIAFTSSTVERNRMIVALILIVEAIIFFSLYFQMPTSLTFFAEHNVTLTLFGWNVPAAEYQFLNPFWIIIFAPILAVLYKKSKLSYVAKFCIGMFLMFATYAILYLTKFFAVNGFVSGYWLVLTYATSGVGELLISGLGLAMVAELCPAAISGFVMGFWFIASMLASYLASFMGSFIAAPKDDSLTAQQSLNIYTSLFGYIAIALLIITIIMIIVAPYLNKHTNNTHVLDDHKADIDTVTYHPED